MIDHSIYRAEILEHYRDPQNFGKLKKNAVSAYYVNPLCGDEIELQLLFDNNKRVKDVRFSGVGCALSIASASLFTESLKEKRLAQLKKIKAGQVVKNLGIPIGTARRKCVLMPYQALGEILKKLV